MILARSVRTASGPERYKPIYVGETSNGGGIHGMCGQNAAQVVSLVRWIGGLITHWADDLLRPLRR